MAHSHQTNDRDWRGRLPADRVPYRRFIEWTGRHSLPSIQTQNDFSRGNEGNMNGQAELQSFIFYLIFPMLCTATVPRRDGFVHSRRSHFRRRWFRGKCFRLYPGQRRKKKSTAASIQYFSSMLQFIRKLCFRFNYKIISRSINNESKQQQQRKKTTTKMELILGSPLCQCSTGQDHQLACQPIRLVCGLSIQVVQ